MAHDVFISYAHTDKPTADAVCATLEARGIRCWIAPRDVLPGVIYSAAIVEAIRASRVFVLVFSAESNISPHVMRELERAVHAEIAVLPLRIEDVPLSPSMEYFISTPHWLDALTPPLEQHLAHLADTVKLLLEKADSARTGRAAEAAPAPSVAPARAAERPAPVAPGEPPAALTSNDAPPVPIEGPRPEVPAPRTTPERAVSPSENARGERAPATEARVLVRPPSDAAPARRMPTKAIALTAGTAVVLTGALVLASGLLGTGGPQASSTAPSSTDVARVSPSAAASTAPTALPTLAPTWTATRDMTSNRFDHTATLLANGTVLVAGGQAGDSLGIASAELYDPAAGTWTPTGSMTRKRFGQMAVLLKNGMVLVIAGTSDPRIEPADPTNYRAELYDPTTGTWSATGRLSGDHFNGATATLLADGRVLVAGGDLGERRTADSEIYDPRTGTWRDAGRMRTMRSGHTATLLADGRVLVAGGSPTGVGDVPPTASAEVYDPQTGKWTATGSMAVGRTRHASVRLTDGRILVVGGQPVLDGDPGTALTSAELYDPGSRTWSATASMPSNRELPIAVLLRDGRVLVAGGIPPAEGKLSFPSELFHPDTLSWEIGPKMVRERYRGAAALLDDGRRVLATGGTVSSDGSSATRTAEVFDPGG